MVNVNLLPEEMRRKEEDERKAIAKNPPVLKYHLTNPEYHTAEAPLKEAKESRLAALFSNKNKKSTPQGNDKDFFAPPESYKQRFSQSAPVPKIQPDKKPSFFGKVRFVRNHTQENIQEKPQEKVFSLQPKVEKPLPLPSRPLSYEAKREVEVGKPQFLPVQKKEVEKKIRKKRNLFGWLSKFFARRKKVSVPKTVVAIPVQAPPKIEIKKEVEIPEPLIKKVEIQVPKQSAPPPVVSVPPVKEDKFIPAITPKIEPLGASFEKKEKQKKVFEKTNGFSNLEINFIPKEKINLSDQSLGRKSFLMIFGLVISLILVVVGNIGVAIYKKNLGDKITLTNDRIESLQHEIDNFEKVVENARQLQSLIDRIDTMLGKHLYWTKVFAALQDNTIDNVYYENFVAVSNGEVILRAVGKNYESVARQLLAFQKAEEFVEVVEINSASAVLNALGEIETVSFDVSLKLNPDIFIIQFTKQE